MNKYYITISNTATRTTEVITFPSAHASMQSFLERCDAADMVFERIENEDGSLSHYEAGGRGYDFTITLYV